MSLPVSGAPDAILAAGLGGGEGGAGGVGAVVFEQGAVKAIAAAWLLRLRRCRSAVGADRAPVDDLWSRDAGAVVLFSELMRPAGGASTSFRGSVVPAVVAIAIAGS